MKLLLIRHGETEHNVAGLLAGVTDSLLTNHGLLQTQRVGSYLAERGIKLTQIYSSDLSRAHLTAKAISDAQEAAFKTQPLGVVQLQILREQDFGSSECTPWASKRDGQATIGPTVPGYVAAETKEAMTARAEVFWNDYVLPLLAIDSEEENIIAVVSHGLFLGSLWRTLLARFESRSIALGPEVSSNTTGRPLQYLPAWTNTGILEFDILPISTTSTGLDAAVLAEPLVSDETAMASVESLAGWRMVVRAVNNRTHLQNLKRTRGGVGSATYDARQKNIDSFFKRPKVEE